MERSIPARTARALLAPLLALALAACGGGGTKGTDTGPVASGPTLQSLAIGTGQGYAVVGAPEPLVVTGTWSDGSTAVVSTGLTWRSSASAVASVDASGLLIPWARGAAVITATHAESGLTATLDLTAREVVAVTAGAAPSTPGTVDTSASYFHVTGLTPGVIYQPTVTGMSDDVDLAVYSDLSMAKDTLLCASDRIGLVSDHCLAVATGSGELWIAVDGEWTRNGASFTLTVDPAQPAELTGTLAFPAALPYAGSVGTTRQYFQLTGLDPRASYEVRITNLTADIDLAVYADQYKYALLCESYLSGTADDACVATATGGGNLFVEIDGETTREGGSYTLAVTPK